MAAGVSRNEHKLTLDIRTKSVEQTLVPLVTQITTLVNAKEKPIRSERTLAALVRVGQAVNLAVERFVGVGEAIANDNPEIHNEMCDACRDAKMAGSRIETLTDVKMDDPGTVRTVAEKTAMVRAARQLLSAITKVLILADRVIIKQLVAAKDKVLNSLLAIEACMSFTDFVRVFSQFGNDMVQLAHLSGDRQNDLKSDRSRTQMAAARAVLEKSTMMLLSSTKAWLRHLDCESARLNRDGVITQIKRALEVIQLVVMDGTGTSSGSSLTGNDSFGTGGPGRDISPLSANAADSGISLSQHQAVAFKAIKDFEDLVELIRLTGIGPDTEARLVAALEILIETSQDFTDSAYTTHDHRQHILMISEQLRHQLAVLLRVGIVALEGCTNQSQELETSILKMRETLRNLKKQLIETAMDQAAEVFARNEDQQLLTALKACGLSGQREKVNELSVKFDEHADQLQEVCKLLRHVANAESLVIWSDHVENMFRSLTPEMLQAAATLACYPNSKMAAENIDVFANAWSSQINDLSVLVKDINDACHGKADRQVYLSLPRPGKHGSTARGVKPTHLTGEEQAKIAKAGLEMKLITSEMDAEAEKWKQKDCEIVKRAKNMSSMAFSMYLFTRGEGPLHTTQDLFIQAEYFAEEGTKLFHAVKHFSTQIPAGGHKTELVSFMDRVPVFCQQINQTIRAQTVGKAATFSKVDKVIQETKNLMNAVAKVVTICFICSSKYAVEYTSHVTSPKASPFNGDNMPDSETAPKLRSESLQQPFRRSSSLTSKPATDRL